MYFAHFVHFFGVCSKDGSNVISRNRNFQRFNVHENEWSTCLQEILECAKDACLNWPKEEERDVLPQKIKEKYGWANRIGCFGGELLLLLFKLKAEDCRDYHGLNLEQSTSVLAVPDEHLFSQGLQVGWSRHVHVDRVMSHYNFLKNKSKYFAPVKDLISG